MIRILLALMMGLTISGCSLMPTTPATNYPYPTQLHTKPGVTETSNIRRALLQQYHQWRGAPYRLGGLGKDGIDCSGFVYLTFHQQLGIPIPRTTAHQASLGQPVPLQELSAGDLVFFKTGFKTRHVGIYLGDGTFVHASTSSGVTLSRLDADYWRKHFWHARRLALN